MAGTPTETVIGAQAFEQGMGIYGNFYCKSTTSGIVPSPTHTQAGAVALTVENNEITPANASDGVILPPALAGLTVIIHNASATLAAQIYANGSDHIGSTAGSTGVSLAAATVTSYICFVTGTWITK
jgi:hypothetical protein